MKEVMEQIKSEHRFALRVEGMHPAIRSTAVIALCFLLTSTGWLSWEYHLMEQIPTGLTDMCTMVVGYLLQAAGIGIYACCLRRRPALLGTLFPLALLVHMVCMVPAVRSPYVTGTLVFGLLMNIACGVIAGYYLYHLTWFVPCQNRASAFGIGYGLSIMASWLLSLIGRGSIYYSEHVLLVCLLLTAAAYWVAAGQTGVVAKTDSVAAGQTGAVAKAREEGGAKVQVESVVEPDSVPVPGKYPSRSFLGLAVLLVLLFSVVNSSGFAFPAADLGQSVNVEFSRLVYAVGLILAGVMTDRNRKYGAICALIALIIPFVILALKGGSISVILFWVLSYFAFGFYAVYRIILFSDIASESGWMFLSGFGLLVGRIGDAVGEMLCLVLANRLVAIVFVTATLFAASVAVFFRLYQVLYVPEAARQLTERERFAQFAAEHDLSPREQDVMHQILENKTVSEIAASLSISENTVKYHVRNILQKTGCHSRKELIGVYNA